MTLEWAIRLAMVTMMTCCLARKTNQPQRERERAVTLLLDLLQNASALCTRFGFRKWKLRGANQFQEETIPIYHLLYHQMTSSLLMNVWFEATWMEGGCNCLLSKTDITSQMIYRGGEPERALHCWFNVMAHKPWITAEFVTVCCSMSMVSNTLSSHFFCQWLHTHF